MTSFRLLCRPAELDVGLCLKAGQTFRWRGAGENWFLSDGSTRYRLSQDEGGIDVETSGSRAQFDFLFDMDRDYQKVRESILDAAPELGDSLRPLSGLRLMRQSSPVEVLFTFLCTQNNHLARIHQMVDRLASLQSGAGILPALAGIPDETEAGLFSQSELDLPRKIVVQSATIEWFASAARTPAQLSGFPSLEFLASQHESDLRELGFGYRARSVVGSAQMALSLGGEAWLESLRQASYEDAHRALTQLPGIGPKVADCVCLYGLHHMRAVPVDVHIWKAAVDRYFPEWRGKSLTPQRYQAIAGLFRDKFGDLAGHAQQMVFVDRLRQPRKAKAKRVWPHDFPRKRHQSGTNLRQNQGGFPRFTCVAMSFVHVHNHTEYSLLDGANRIPDMVARAKELGMDALAISDHGVMFGVMEFFFECKKQGIKPILGMEAYVAPNGLRQKTGREENQSYHLLLLARNIEGYRNLCKLHSVAALEGFYYKPRIDHELLREHSKGLIGTSACLSSEICRELLRGTYDRAQYLAGMYKEIFDEGCFFIELQDHRLPDQAKIKEPLLKIAREVNLPLVATNDAHYLCKTDAEPHDVLLCVGTGRLKADEDRLKFDTDEFYLKTPAEMAELFSDTPEALENTLRIAEMCDVQLGNQRALMPTPEMPEGHTAKSYLRELAEKGLERRLPTADDAAWERLNYELGVIEKTGFDDYFLLVREFADFTRAQDIYFGVRGSAAGSLVSYTLGITDVDPLEYDLTFERFLNPERISMPDIDMDFEDARRDEVIRWVTERYGADRVAQIVTFGTLGAKAAIKDAGRVLGYSPQETDRICKTIPNLVGMSLKKAHEEINEFKQMVENEPSVRALVEVAESVEGLSRHCGVHAAGIVIAKDPLSEHIPLYRGNDGQPITAFEMGILEKIGLLKMDFLGLSNLTVLAKTIENVNKYAMPSPRGAAVPPALSENFGEIVSPTGGENEHGAQRGRDGRATGGEVYLYSDELPIEKRDGRYLPHWTQEHATYSVTFRLDGSLPQHVLEQYRFERQAIIGNATLEGRELTGDEVMRLATLQETLVETELDRGYGECWMARSEVADVVAEALAKFHLQRYVLHGWCVMPNHVHAVVEVLPGEELAKILRSWKSFTAKAANKLLDRDGSFWQDEYYDHLIRDEAEFARAVDYVEGNARSAGLKDWKWCGSLRGAAVPPAQSQTSKETVSQTGGESPSSAQRGRDGRATGEGFTVNDIPFEDPATFEMLSRGETVGVFQLESGGMRRNIIELKPTSVKELAAMVALYRPGPMDHIPTYINNKFGRTQPAYHDERMRPILEETYGVIVYQDQVLKLVQALAGFSLGKADILRRAMGKKDKAAMDSMMVEFMEGAQERGVAKEAAEKVWELLLPFAGYAFNKAHAVCYAILAYQTAYLKANYPVEYLAALLAVYRSKEDRVTAFIEECRRQGISVLPPDVNLSGVDFTIEEQMPVHKNGKNGKKPPAPVKSIRFGLAAIKGVGEGIVESLIQERAEKPFSHLYEFCERIKPYGMNRAALDALIKSGALDCIDKNRKKLLEFAEPAMTFADNALRNRQAGQDSLFGGSDDTTSTTHYPALPEQQALARSEALTFEKEVLGIYVSDHPLRGYEQAIRRAATHRCDSISELDEGTNVKLAGLIANTRAITTKRGDKMATLVLEDLSGQAGCTLFAATYAKLRDLVEKDKVVSLSGVVTYRDRTINGGERTVEVRVEDIQLIDPSQEISMDDDDETLGTLVIRVQKATKDQLVGLRQLIEQTPGEYGVVIQLGDGEGILPIQLLRRVDAGPEFRTKALRAVAQCEMELIKKVSLVGGRDSTED